MASFSLFLSAEVVASEQVSLVGFRVDAARRGQPRPFLRSHLSPNLVSDRPRHFALQFQHVGQFAFVVECPEKCFLRRPESNAR